MRTPRIAAVALLAILLTLQGSSSDRADETPKSEETDETEQVVEFERDVAPILERCHPCHFPGGKKYDDLPFDDPKTIDLLGEKLFTRIKDENERAMIREFLAQRRKP